MKNSIDKETIEKIKSIKRIEEIIKPEHKALSNLLLKLFEIDPKKRISCKNALNHNFFQIDYS